MDQFAGFHANEADSELYSGPLFKLHPVDSLDVIAVDNFIDVLLPSEPRAVRPPLASANRGSEYVH
jgi:hypothetical protein